MSIIAATRYRRRDPKSGRDVVLYDATGPDGREFLEIPHIAEIRLMLRQRYGQVTVTVVDREAEQRIETLRATEAAAAVAVRSAELAGELRSAPEAGSCDCCMKKYPAGSRLQLEFGKYWVLVDHPPFKFKDLGGK